MRIFALVTFATLSVSAAADEFVRTDGTHFVVDGKPFAFVGANLAAMHGQPYRERYEATLDAARADGLTVGRVWALGEGGPDASECAKKGELFRLGPEEWVEESFVHLDHVIAAARDRKLRLIVTLANQWSDYGGVPAYLNWAGLPASGWGARDRFFDDEKVRAFYRAHVTRLLERKSTVTGVRYADEPTVFAWELMNESQVDGEDGARARRAWIVEMAQLIRAHDSHHLITPGLVGYASRKERGEWLAVCKLPEVDYCDSHLYPQTTNPVASRAELERVIDDRVQLAHYIAKKPIVFGEFGFDTRAASWRGRARAGWFSDFLSRVFKDGGDGALVWIYQPWSGTARDYGIYVDRPDTDDVRAVLRAIAARVAQALPKLENPLLGPQRGLLTLYDPYRTVKQTGHPRVVTDAEHVTVELTPEEFDFGRFERVGTWAGGTLTHTYGAGDGRFEWRFRLPADRAATAATVALRISSEFPGTEAPPDGDSRVDVYLDGIKLATVEAPPDDGLGRVVRIPVGARALARLKGGGEHVLKLDVPPGPKANGVCIYGQPTGRAPPPEEVTPIRVVLTKSAPGARDTIQP